MTKLRKNKFVVVGQAVTILNINITYIDKKQYL